MLRGLEQSQGLGLADPGPGHQARADPGHQARAEPEQEPWAKQLQVVPGPRAEVESQPEAGPWGEQQQPWAWVEMQASRQEC